MTRTPPTRPAACAAFAPRLPLAGHDLLSDADDARLREHLATCADCRADLAIYDRVEATWQRTFAPDQAHTPLLAQADLLHTLQSEGGAAPPPHNQSAAEMPVPALPVAPPRRHSRLVVAASTLAACLLIAAIVNVLFLARGYNIHLPGGRPEVTATKAATPPGYQNLSISSYNDIAMVSANEGWAVGGTYVAVYDNTNNPGTLYEKTLLEHYLNGTWTTVQLPIHGQLSSISMDSPTDGWAIGMNDYDQTQDRIILLHYNGQTWQQVPSQGINGMISQVQMLSPTDGWMIGSPFPIRQNQALQNSGIWHYNGQTWQEQPLPSSLSQLLQQGGGFQVSGISMISATEGWAAATYVPPESVSPAPTATPTPTTGDLSPVGIILHYTGGQWEEQNILPKTYLHAVSMASAENGWIGGEHDTRTLVADPNTPDGVTEDKTSPLLLRYIQGHWETATSSVNANLSGIYGFQSIFMDSATDGWMVYAPTNLPGDTPTLLHYSGSQWRAVNLPTVKNTSIYRLARVFFTSPTEGWLVGGRDVKSSPGYTDLSVSVLYHLHNGIWSVVQS